MPINIIILVPKAPTKYDSDNLILKLSRVQDLVTKLLIKKWRIFLLGSPRTTLLSSLKFSSFNSSNKRLSEVLTNQF